MIFPTSNNPKTDIKTTNDLHSLHSNPSKFWE